MFNLIFATTALAATPIISGVGAGVSGTGESMMQDGLVRAYESLGGSFSLEGVLTVSGVLPIEATIEVGYRRVSGTLIGTETSSWFWYIPATLLVSGRYDTPAVSLLGGLGPSWVIYAEQPGESSGEARSDAGARPGVLFEVSARWHTGAIKRSMHDPDQGPKDLDVFLAAGYRYSDVSDAARDAGTCAEPPCGIDLSAFRLSAGAMVRF